jgi:hypothetical protein
MKDVLSTTRAAACPHHPHHLHAAAAAAVCIIILPAQPSPPPPPSASRPSCIAPAFEERSTYGQIVRPQPQPKSCAALPARFFLVRPSSHPPCRPAATVGQGRGLDLHGISSERRPTWLLRTIILTLPLARPTASWRVLRQSYLARPPS